MIQALQHVKARRWPAYTSPIFAANRAWVVAVVAVLLAQLVVHISWLYDYFTDNAHAPVKPYPKPSADR